jgi:hypothetical protein
MRQVYSQVVEWEQLRDTAEDYENRNGEIHHATTNLLALTFEPNCNLES